MDHHIAEGIVGWHGPMYKYKSLAGKGIDHIRDMIQNRRIFCPKPSQLNDPLECKPTMLFGNVDDTAYRHRVESWVRRCVKHRNPVPSEEQIQAELRIVTQERLDVLLPELHQAFHAALEQRVRIVSFADSPFNHHLWMEYANKYTGVCLIYDLPSRVASAYRVHYTDTMDVLDVIAGEDDFGAMKSSVLVKRTKWQFEKECRLVLGEPPFSKGDPFLKQQMLHLPDEALRGIVFGYRVSDTDVAAVLEVASPKEKLKIFFASGGVPFRSCTVQRLLYTANLTAMDSPNGFRTVRQAVSYALLYWTVNQH